MSDKVILQAITAYVKNQKGLTFGVSLDGSIKPCKLLRHQPDTALGFNKRITITVIYDGEVK